MYSTMDEHIEMTDLEDPDELWEEWLFRQPAFLEHIRQSRQSAREGRVKTIEQIRAELAAEDNLLREDESNTTADLGRGTDFSLDAHKKSVPSPKSVVVRLRNTEIP